jgi:hypothetical protein
MNKANIDQLDSIYSIFSQYRDIFPHIRKDYLKRMIEKQCVIYSYNTVIVFNVYKRSQRLGKQSQALTGDVILHQIVTKYLDTGRGKNAMVGFLDAFKDRYIYLTVRASNKRAIQFYLKNDFKIIDEIYWSKNTIKGLVLKHNPITLKRSRMMAKKVIKKSDVTKKGSQGTNKTKTKATKKLKDGAEKKGRTANPFRSKARAYCAELMLSRKYTDAQIVEKANKQFPDYQINTSFVSGSRWNLNRGGRGLTKPKTPVERMVEVDGKIVPASEKPKRKTKKKYTEENDPLRKTAGINVHKKETKKPEKVKKAG